MKDGLTEKHPELLNPPEPLSKNPSAEELSRYYNQFYAHRVYLADRYSHIAQTFVKELSSTASQLRLNPNRTLQEEFHLKFCNETTRDLSEKHRLSFQPVESKPSVSGLFAPEAKVEAPNYKKDFDAEFALQIQQAEVNPRRKAGLISRFANEIKKLQALDNPTTKDSAFLIYFDDAYFKLSGKRMAPAIEKPTVKIDHRIYVGKDIR